MKRKVSVALHAIVVMILGTLVSCEKSEQVVSSELNGEKGDVISIRTNEMARSLSDFTPGRYSIDQIYKDAYYHINQYDQSASASYPDGWPGGITNPGNCSWSNYIMAVGCVGRASGTLSSDEYKLDKARRLKKFMKDSRGSYDNGSVMQYIYEDYGLVYDNPNRVGLRHWKTSKAKWNHPTITEELLKHLRDFKTPIVMLGATEGGYGHYYTIVSIVWGGTIDNSDIWFCNSLEEPTGANFEESRKTMPLRTFLNLMSNGHASDYTRCNVLFTYNLNL